MRSAFSALLVCAFLVASTAAQAELEAELDVVSRMSPVKKSRPIDCAKAKTACAATLAKAGKPKVVTLVKACKPARRCKVVCIAGVLKRCSRAKQRCSKACPGAKRCRVCPRILRRCARVLKASRRPGAPKCKRVCKLYGSPACKRARRALFKDKVRSGPKPKPISKSSAERRMKKPTPCRAFVKCTRK